MVEPKEIVYSKRKTLALMIDRNGDLIVKAPIGTSKSRIFSFISQKESWIMRKTEEVKSYSLAHEKKPISDGDELMIFGNGYRVRLFDGRNVLLTNRQIWLPKEMTEKRFEKFLRNFARETIEQRTKQISEKIGLGYSGIRITSAKGRWGSCSADNSLNFSFRLAYCPMGIVDYVIIHELCHTVQKNHQKQFWDLVESFVPNYKQCDKWLKDNRFIMQ